MNVKVFILCILALGLVGCRGSNGKKMVEVGETLVKKWKKVPSPARGKVNRVILDELNQCSTCDGYGVLCLVDQYGNPIYDYSGNLQLIKCDKCGGSGKYISW